MGGVTDVITAPFEAVGDLFGGGGGGSSSAPASPTLSGTVSDWASQLPQIYQAQLQYSPLLAQQQVDLASKYVLPLAQQYYNAQKAMYPGTVGLQESLAAQAQTGMGQGLSDAEKAQYRSDLAAQLGTNVGSGIGSDYMSRNMLMQQQNRQDYWRNLALSTAGRQPLTQASGVSTPDYMSNFTPTSAMNYAGQNYGNYANAYTNMYSANQQAQSGIMGGLLGAAGSIGAGMMMSSARYKDNVIAWE